MSLDAARDCEQGSLQAQSWRNLDRNFLLGFQSKGVSRHETSAFSRSLGSGRSLENVLGDRVSREQSRSDLVKLSVPVLVLAETREREQVQEEAVTAAVNA